jgi:nucleoside-diphosphate-sugar epimerase
MNILLTGATGFIGKSLSSVLEASSHNLISVVRSQVSTPHVIVPNIDGDTDWSNILPGIDVVIHLAARVHVMRESSLDASNLYRHANVDATINLAKQSLSFGVKRFIFLSSIKAMGDQTIDGGAFTTDTICNPEDPYGRSKLEAELALHEIIKMSEMELVIIRPPLVYGPGVKANFQSLIKLVQMGIPLPLAGIRNKRSLIGIDNLVDLIVSCVSNPAAANQTFLASDDQDLSTSELLSQMANSLGLPSRLFKVPELIPKFFTIFPPAARVVDRLYGSLQVDISRTKQILGWNPPFTVDDGLNKIATFISALKN